MLHQMILLKIFKVHAEHTRFGKYEDVYVITVIILVLEIESRASSVLNMAAFTISLPR